ncbi:MAG: hypothetical protein A2513_03170 [Sulfurimonas sp. RIFOXYD12_FULL_33_39]|uniref:sensor domain-containing diguanylate cyclase n=1 Tax=unclassified Sulfurimonas TaxID=2623549 RepID=UPI0008C7AAC3|nr:MULTISPECIES: sensor domain-containing diguanylate cyclase [unclassified Sulfurimonas]OHE08992.1 MAG: hypothetical protein A2513_03170 [Sulfurimonas sp. RIFOXYD12_FULL_33_39]OHE14302.1 MAG: hypothetical protein A2530_06470 [Sulfurimonas sp. RIFOXYD2_FULL_34_21]
MSDIYKLKRLNFIILGLIVILFLIGITKLLQVNFSSEHYTKLINIAGKQRALSQKVIFEVKNHHCSQNQDAYEKLRIVAKEYFDNNKELINFIRIYKLDLESNISQNANIKEFIKNINSYIQNFNEKSYQDIINNRDDIFNELNNFVENCESVYHEKYLNSLKIISLIGFVTTLLIVVYYISIFKKSLNYLNKYLRLINLEKDNIKNIFNSLESIIFEKNKDGTYLFTNNAFYKMFQENIVGKKDTQIFDEKTTVKLANDDLIVINEQKPTSREIELHVDGKKRIFSIKKFPLIDENGDIKICGIALDITKEKEFQYKKDELNEMVDNHIIVSYTDRKGIITDISKAFCRLCGYEKYELVGQDHNILGAHEQEALLKELWECIERNNIWHGEFENRKKDGTIFYIESSIMPHYSFEKKKLGYMMLAKDITDKKLIEKLSITDSLTDLYNRRFFDEVFEKKVSIGIREKGKVCLFMCDIDNFKSYNDTYGHQMGDMVLKEISKSLKGHFCRAGDFVCRIGGEEFAVILTILGSEQLDTFANQIIKKVEALSIEHIGNEPFNVVTISASIVVVDFDKTTKIFSVDDIYKMADDKLYYSKRNGKNILSSLHIP